MNDRTIPHEAAVRAVIRDEAIPVPVFEGSEGILPLITEGVHVPNILTAESYISLLGSQENYLLLRLEEVGILTTTE